jgi:hypothetical protein
VAGFEDAGDLAGVDRGDFTVETPCQANAEVAFPGGWLKKRHSSLALPLQRLGRACGAFAILFFADVTNQARFVWDAGSRELNKTHVEASVRQEIFRVAGDHVQLRGLRFRYAANMAQHGAVVLAGRHNVMEDCVIEAVNASEFWCRRSKLLVAIHSGRIGSQFGS